VPVHCRMRAFDRDLIRGGLESFIGRLRDEPLAAKIWEEGTRASSGGHFLFHHLHQTPVRSYRLSSFSLRPRGGGTPRINEPLPRDSSDRVHAVQKSPGPYASRAQVRLPWCPASHPAPSFAAACLFPPPALRECFHGGLACRRISVSGRAMAESQRPHPCPDRRCLRLHDAADHDAIGEHVKVVLPPFARGTARRCALDDQIVFFHLPSGDLAWGRVCRSR
jgi:hypothetical protein